MDLPRLRELLRPLIENHAGMNNHATLPSVCEQLHLPTPPNEGSKKERILDSFYRLSDVDLPQVAECLLTLYPPLPTVRNKIQDILWEDMRPKIPKKFRRDVARALDYNIYMDIEKFSALLDRLWILDDDPFDIFMGGPSKSLRGEIDRHVFRNTDWSAEELFNKLGAFEASDKRFALFLEGLASSDVRPDEDAQRRFVQTVNVPLRKCGFEMIESGTEGGYPIFTIISSHATTKSRPKNLIFASSVKPDLRFKDAVNNDIEIVTNADKVLVYDRPIGVAGLLWRDLQDWWRETNNITDDTKAKESLYRRLRRSLPKESPPQALLFESYYRSFGSAVLDFPALLPEVWLHWDPKTVKERGPDALLRFRMDFLLLLPNNVRVVIEVDGKQHYAHDDGRADCTRYARMVAADRELKLAGYHLFRFGAEELQGETARIMVHKFFEDIFKQYGASVSQTMKQTDNDKEAGK